MTLWEAISGSSVRSHSRARNFHRDFAPLAVRAVAAWHLSDCVLVTKCLADSGGRLRNVRLTTDREAQAAGLLRELIEKRKSAPLFR